MNHTSLITSCWSLKFHYPQPLSWSTTRTSWNPWRPICLRAVGQYARTWKLGPMAIFEAKNLIHFIHPQGSSSMRWLIWSVVDQSIWLIVDNSENCSIEHIIKYEMAHQYGWGLGWTIYLIRLVTQPPKPAGRRVWMMVKEFGHGTSWCATCFAGAFED